MTFFKSLQKPFAKKAMTCVKASLGRVYSRFFKSSSPGVGSDFHMQTLRETFEKSSKKPISHTKDEKMLLCSKKRVGPQS